MMYFRDKIRAEIVGECRVLAAWVVLLNIFVLSDVDHQIWRTKVFRRLERTQAPGRENFMSLGVAMTSDSGWGGGGIVRRIGGEIKARDPHAVTLAFYPGGHVRPNAEGTARNREPKPPL